MDSCPFCLYDYCDELKSVDLEYSTLRYFTFNLFSVKNLNFGKHLNGHEIVIKKIRYEDNFNLESNNNDRICNSETTNEIFERISYRGGDLSFEPVILELFSKADHYSVPKFYGYCGRTFIIENCGVALNEIENFDWFDRVYISYQLLAAVEQFTLKHSEFRLYLIDISPDNIVVNLRNFKATFIDFNHVILQKKKLGQPHYTEFFEDEEDFVFSSRDICDSSVSDHNIYAVCKLLLSKNAPWPMMKNGLLHSSPKSVSSEELFNEIELCVHSELKSSRFIHSKKIKNILKNLLEKEKYFERT